MMPGRLVESEGGTALVAAIVLVLLLSAAGLGLALTAALEPAIARHFETGGAALAVAESALVLAGHDLVGTADWTPVLNGGWIPSLLEPASDATVVSSSPRVITVGTLTNRATCGRDAPCGDGDVAAVTEDRPWGLNNPRFRLLGILRGGHLAPEPSMSPYLAVVWAGDDPAEADGNPLVDGGAAPAGPLGLPPGLGRVVLRAEAFGPGGAHRALQAVLERSEGGGPSRLRDWSVR